MEANNLVVSKESFNLETDSFKRGKIYRCISLAQNEDIQLLVYGIVFDLVSFSDKFEFLHNIVRKEWTDMGLIVDGKPLTKAKFKTLLDFHVYGKGKSKFYSAYAWNEHPKKLLYQFNTAFAENKTSFINTIYENYLSVLNGDYTAFDDEMICRGNSGIPLSFNSISWR